VRLTENDIVTSMSNSAHKYVAFEQWTPLVPLCGQVQVEINAKPYINKFAYFTADTGGWCNWLT
jgi:hypothetical protein